MNRLTPLLHTPEIELSLFDHPPHHFHDDPEEECAGSYALNFVERGSFELAIGKAWVRVPEGQVLVTHPGLRFRCRHEEQCPTDECLSLAVAEELVESLPSGAAELVRQPIIESRHLAFVHRRIRTALQVGARLVAENWALHGIAMVGKSGSGARDPLSDRLALDTVLQVCEEIERDPARQRSIGEMARDAGLNSFQLTRRFQAYLGLAPHQYVLRQRLQTAASRLAEGASVTDTCYRVGFENLSHFCRTFARTLGIVPSRWRTLVPREQRHRMRAMQVAKR